MTSFHIERHTVPSIAKCAMDGYSVALVLLAGCVEDQNGCDGIKGFGGKLDVEGFAVLRDLERGVFGIGKEVRAGDLARHLVDVEAVGPVEDFYVDLVGLGGGAPVPGGGELGVAALVLLGGAEGSGGDVEDGGGGSVDGVAVDLEPLAHLLEALDLGLRDDAVGVRPDVEEVVAALADDVDEVAEENFGGLEVGVEVLVAPGVVDGHAGLPVAAGETLRGDVLLGGLGVAFVGSAEAVVPDEVGVFVEDLDDLGGALGGHLLGSVEPNDDGVVLVVVEELFDLGDGFLVEVIVEGAILRGVPVAGLEVVVSADCCGSAGGCPVLCLRVVEAELHALLATLFGELAQGVALVGSGGDDVEGVDLGVEHGEAVVVLGGDDDVLHAGGFGEGDDVVRGEAGGVELRGEGFVVGDGDGEVVHDPLTDVVAALSLPLSGGDGVEAPVDEHSEAGVAPPLHAGVALGGSFGVLDGGDGMIGGSGVGLGVLELGVGERRGEKQGSGDGAMERFHSVSFPRNDGSEIIGESLYLLVQVIRSGMK
jgi:hypothetical protein